jgi:putative FmdB family regulatory protein
MPVYEYQCKACGHEFEREQRISEAPVKKCPSCGALKARRQISRTSFVLKGGGWYSDLYGTAKPAAASTSETSAAGESKPAAETAPSPSSGDGKGDGGGKGDSPGKGPKKGGKGAKAAA